jgi:ADP-heptose:LPS heptosyltransferase
LRAAFPQARLTLLTTDAHRDLAARLQPLDQIVCLDDSGPGALLHTTARALMDFRRRPLDLYVDLEAHSAFAKLLSWGSGARQRLGFEGGSAAAGRGLATHTRPFDRLRPLRHLYLDLAREGGIATSGSDQLTAPRVDDADRTALRQRLDGWWCEGEPYVVVNPNASALSLERRWPAERFTSLVEALARDGHRVALVGSEAERDYVGGVAAHLVADGGRVVNAAGRLSLGELLALLDESACVVSNDSGPMHMAITLGRPTVGLFGPCSPAQFGIEGGRVAVAYHAVPCSPCVHSGSPPPCRGDNICMKGIAVADVLALVRARLSSPRP